MKDKKKQELRQRKPTSYEFTLNVVWNKPIILGHWECSTIEHSTLYLIMLRYQNNKRIPDSTLLGEPLAETQAHPPVNTSVACVGNIRMNGALLVPNYSRVVRRATNPNKETPMYIPCRLPLDTCRTTKCKCDAEANETHTHVLNIHLSVVQV